MRKRNSKQFLDSTISHTVLMSFYKERKNDVWKATEFWEIKEYC